MYYLDPEASKQHGKIIMQMMELKKEKNFFETRVTEYQTGGALSWD